MEPSAIVKYDLTDGNYLGRMFTVVYRIETTVYEEENDDEEDEEENYEEENYEDEDQDYIIVDL